MICSGSGLLWQSKGAKAEAGGVDKAERLPHLHHLLQACNPGSQQFQVHTFPSFILDPYTMKYA